MHTCTTDGESSGSFLKAAPLVEYLYTRYQRPIEWYLSYLTNDRDTAADLCQDTFMRALEHAHQLHAVTLETADSHKPWLYRIAKNLAIDYRRHYGRYVFVPLPADSEHGQTVNGRTIDLSVTGHEEMVCELLLAGDVLAELSPQYRECLLLRVCYGLSNREIAEKLHVKEKTVSANISRGVVQVRLHYEECWSDDQLAYAITLTWIIPAGPLAC